MILGDGGIAVPHDALHVLDRAESCGMGCHGMAQYLEVHPVVQPGVTGQRRQHPILKVLFPPEPTRLPAEHEVLFLVVMGDGVPLGHAGVGSQAHFLNHTLP